MILILGGQYALLMQIPDALAWRYPEEQYPGKIAFFLNVTQIFHASMCLAVLCVSLTSLHYCQYCRHTFSH